MVSDVGVARNASAAPTSTKPHPLSVRVRRATGPTSTWSSNLSCPFFRTQDGHRDAFRRCSLLPSLRLCGQLSAVFGCVLDVSSVLDDVKVVVDEGYTVFNVTQASELSFLECL